MSFASGSQQLPPGTQPVLVTSDAKGNQVPIPAAAAPPPDPGGQAPPVEPPAAPSAEPDKPKEAPVAAKPKPNKPSAKPNKRRSASGEAVLSRARRMYRSQMKKVAQALGFDEYDEATFNAKIEEMTQSQQASLSTSERQAGQLKEVETSRSHLLGEKQSLQTELNKARRGLQAAEKQLENFRIEVKLRETARDAGIRDPDYALHLLMKHSDELPEGQEPDVPAFFENLKRDASKRHLFNEESVPAGPRPVAEQQPNQPAQPTGEPQSQQVPQPPPKPAGPAGAEMPNALEMDDQTYNAHLKERYGYTRGTA